MIVRKYCDGIWMHHYLYQHPHIFSKRNLSIRYIRILLNFNEDYRSLDRLKFKSVWLQNHFVRFNLNNFKVLFPCFCNFGQQTLEILSTRKRMKNKHEEEKSNLMYFSGLTIFKKKKNYTNRIFFNWIEWCVPWTQWALAMRITRNNASLKHMCLAYNICSWVRACVQALFLSPSLSSEHKMCVTLCICNSKYFQLLPILLPSD